MKFLVSKKIGCLPLSIWILHFTVVNAFLNKTSQQIERALKNADIIPDLVSQAPRYAVQAQFGFTYVDFGTRITMNAMKLLPVKMYWPTDKDALYCLVLIDPDVPTRQDPNDREYQHWIVANIPKHHVERGDVLTDYCGPVPEHISNTHRYIFLVYQQQKKEEFHDWRFIDRRPIKRLRARFSVAHFAGKYNLGEPIAMNYFVCSNETVTSDDLDQ